ncbi:uncharacterized protein LOC131009317 [Salvia miltiorrhiza]|uniref:uncharacterized protein LOC131009317 n=1 Tax=Salvia miltiorrhiza TaxID=226208 RepID=UPI0025AB9CF2|nr:uncharacterized protein LOC131009317 [Salvia miltiorrhiza]
MMKKSFFSCFHPLETQTNQINKRKSSKRPLSHVLEILLLKTSLKIKISDRNVRQLLLQPKSATQRRRGRGVEEAKVSIRSPGSRPSLKNTRSSTVAPSSDHGGSRREFRPVTKSCSCKANPGLYLFVATLFFTVVWGRVRAVVFALMLLYLTPVWARFLR